MIEPDMAEALKLAKANRREMSESAIIREALREWLERHEPTPKKRAKK